MMPEGRVAAPVAESEAERLAREVFGVSGNARALPGEYDDNFQLTTDVGSFVLKVMHPARTAGFVDLQCQALTRIADRAPGLAVPRIVPTRDGQTFQQAQLADGSPRLVWMLRYLPGTALIDAQPHSPELLASLGELLGELDTALAGFTHADAERDFKWNLAQAGWIREFLHEIPDTAGRKLVERFLVAYEAEVVPALPQLRCSVIHGDANEHNVIIGAPLPEPRRVGLIDFGDMHHGLVVAEPAVAAAYAMLGKPDVLPTAAALVAGFHRRFPLTEGELGLLHTLIGTRLAVSVVNSAHRKVLKPDDAYVTVSERGAWAALARWDAIPPRFAHYTFRAACGLAPVPRSSSFAAWLCHQRGAPVIGKDLRQAKLVTFDLSVGSPLLGADPANLEVNTLTATMWREMQRAGAEVGVGRYNEPRALYQSAIFAGPGAKQPTDERRTVHLGIDLFVEPGTPVCAPLDGTVHLVANNTGPLDYGPLVILRHDAGDDRGAWFTLYGHLDADVLIQLRAGDAVEQGQEFARIGAPPGNGGWSPHLHFQIILDLLTLDADFPGVAYASQREVWLSLSPDPSELLGLPPEAAAEEAANPLQKRREVLGPNLSVAYRRPLEIVRGWRQYLYDSTGRAFLDAYNNVPLVGHSHPRVVAAAQEQLALLNTNTRYLHPLILRYAERLTAKLPEPLRVCYFVNSGSEANELALRMARTHTKREDVIVLEHAYHGHTNTLIDISPYKFDGPGGAGRKPWVHVAPIPDDYRGRYRRDEPDIGAKYAAHVGELTQQNKVAAFIAETLPSVAGQIVLPDGYLAAAYAHVRAAGGVCIADEVQVGFGRLGTHFWCFEAQGVVPDIVVLGKPMGNGFPLGAVISTPAIAASFANGMEFFSTFGGNPVACAAGLAVLDVLEEEGVQARALRVGRYLKSRLQALAGKHAIIGDVRGDGLFLGVEFVRDRITLEPAAAEADYIVNRLRELGVLTGTDGPHHNVIKLRPPLVFTEADADLLVDALAEVLNEDACSGHGRVARVHTGVT